KDRCEPIRCAKCQNYGHITKNCQATKDCCSTCRKEHHTSECIDDTKKDAWCMSCCNEMHTSWSRACPAFGKCC
ncbi:uncharacterized protein EDB93DRAFT_1085218, partial [Suillus bovinus]|uniref:uncharacterized protein n=1 Tax=Suillus bovinus TaxID=48563 RepID=UPI001B8837BC